MVWWRRLGQKSLKEIKNRCRSGFQCRVTLARQVNRPERDECLVYLPAALMITETEVLANGQAVWMAAMQQI